MLNTDKIVELADVNALPVAGQVSHAIRAGLPLESGLLALAEQTRSPRTRKALIDLSQRLEQGTPLADALHESNVQLPRTMRALVEAGMETGRLDSVMQYCVEQSQRAASLRQQIWMSLAYPMFLTCFSLLICGFILMEIIPQFKKIFDDFGTELPGITIALLDLQHAMREVGWVPLLTTIPIAIGVWALFITFGSSRLGQRWSTSIPLIGVVFRLATLSEFCQILAILTESKLPFPKALRFAASASDDRWLGRQCRRLAHDIEDGSTPEDAAVLAELPNSLSQVFRHSSSDRIFAEALRGLSELYAAQCTVSTRLVCTILEPFAVVLVMGFAGITAIAMFLPLIKLLNDLS